ncbi:hypothetical protein ACRAWD_28535 [Caulobacter segnis]
MTLGGLPTRAGARGHNAGYPRRCRGSEQSGAAAQAACGVRPGTSGVPVVPYNTGTFYHSSSVATEWRWRG